jgi:DNA repair photolyase
MSIEELKKSLKPIHRFGGEGDDSELVLNPFSGCSHRCWYCWARKRYKRELPFQEPAKGAPLKKIKQNLDFLQSINDKTPVLISDLGDPYDCGRKPRTNPFIPGEYWHIRSILMEFRKHDHPFRILTKGGTLAVKDFDLYGPHDLFGCTLTCDNAEDSRKNEPGAALPEDRINVLKEAYKRGIPTWVVLEPVLYPRQTLHLIELTHLFVSYYILGKLNHFPKEEAKIDWPKFRNDAEALLQSYGKMPEEGYLVKRQLVEA